MNEPNNTSDDLPNITLDVGIGTITMPLTEGGYLDYEQAKIKMNSAEPEDTK